MTAPPPPPDDPTLVSPAGRRVAVEEVAGPPRVVRPYPWWLWVLAGAFLALVILFLVLWLMERNDTQDVPSLVGMNIVQARDKTAADGFTLKTLSRPASRPPGTVVDQAPQAGAGLEKGAQVMAIVSGGQEQVTVPKLIGSTATAAEQLLSSQGLSASKKTVNSTHPNGIVVAQDPPEGTKVAKGSTVGLAVSNGQGQVDVPSVEGMSSADAVTTIAKAGLVPVVIQVFDDRPVGFARPVRVRDLNWMQLEEYLGRDDRIVLPVGSTEQHAYLSLETDNILSERVAHEAAEPLGVPVLPALAYGLTPSFAAYPGSVTLRIETYVRVLAELLDSLASQGFRRILIVNGHGGNTPARSRVVEWNGAHPEAEAIWHDWWSSPEVAAAADALDPVWSHASWSENFPWTRLDDVDLPAEPKERVPLPLPGSPAAAREVAGDGSFGGRYARPDGEVLELWRAGVEGVRALLESGWARSSS